MLLFTYRTVSVEQNELVLRSETFISDKNLSGQNLSLDSRSIEPTKEAS